MENKFKGFTTGNFTESENGSLIPELMLLPDTDEILVKTVEDTKLEQSNNPSEYVGVLCVPKKWDAQKDGLIAAGLETQFRLKIPLMIIKSWRKNIGKGCENTVFFQFEGQTDNSHFIGLHFKPVKDE